MISFKTKGETMISLLMMMALATEIMVEKSGNVTMIMKKAAKRKRRGSLM
jgi:hypothetical protein